MFFIWIIFNHAIQSHGPNLFRVLHNDLFLGLKGSMHGMKGEEGKKWSVLVFLDKMNRLIGQAIRQVFPFRAVFHESQMVGTEKTRMAPRTVHIRCFHARVGSFPGPGKIHSSDGNIKSLVRGPVLFGITQMPLSKIACRVVIFLQCFGNA